MDHDRPDLERGMRNRRRILGDAWVDKSVDRANAFTADFQNFITRYAWHEIWGRPGLDARSRRVIVLAITCALGRWEEFELHTRAALSEGDPATRLTEAEVKEVLMQAAIYAGVPAANTAVGLVAGILREIGQPPPPAPADQAYHPGTGRSVRTTSLPVLHATVREPRNGLPARHTVILSHALGCDASLWDGLATALAADCRVVCPDHRGHGASDVPAGPYTLAALADDAARLMAELGLAGETQSQTPAQAPVWVGISMGGMVGQELALRHPGLLGGLVIANSSAGYDAGGRAGWSDRIAAIERGGLDAMADAVLQRWFGPAFHAAHRSTVARWRRRLVSTNPHGYAACCAALRDLDTLPRLPALTVPTLVIAGGDDQATPAAMSEAIARRIPGAALHILPGASHISVLEQPDAFHGLVHRFIDALPQSPTTTTTTTPSP